MSIYLLEVGTEELPYKFIPQAISQLKTGFTNFLNDNKVKFSDIKVYATPRRLAVIVDGLENKTADEEKIVKGPIKTVAFDENGNLELNTSADEGDLLYDEIGSVLKIKQMQQEKQELFESLETYYKVFFLGEDLEDDNGD